jgi:ribosome biogenesis GTPase
MQHRENHNLDNEGTIVRGVGGFYYVDTGEHTVECRARGIFRKENIKPCVGDEVSIELVQDSDTLSGVITEIHERKNNFTRPPVSNVDQFIVVSALANPEPNYRVLDKFLIAAEMRNIDIVICFTKKDLVGGGTIERARDVYSSVYPLLFMDARDPECVRDIMPYLFDKKSALAGPSGVGKSTILRTLRRDSSIQTGSVSEKNKRGRNTTRHVELFKMTDFNGMIFDTPGFTSFDLPDIEPGELAEYYPDIYRYAGSGKCRFNMCLHDREPGCCVTEAVERGDINPYRYQSYIDELHELQQRKKY